MLYSDKTYKFYAVIILVIVIVLSFFRCSRDITKHAYSGEDSIRYSAPTVHFDLDLIKKRGKLILLTENSSTSYFIYKGQPMGYEYELVKKFTDKLGVELEVKIIDDVNTMFGMLNNGEGDIIASNLTVTKKRSEVISFSSPYNHSKQVLVQRVLSKNNTNFKEEKLVKDIFDLGGKKIFVNKSTSYFTRLKSLSEEIGEDIIVQEAPGYIDTENLIKKVSEGEIDYTVADENIGRLNKTYFPNIDVSLELSLPQKIAWGVRHNSPELLDEINRFFDDKSSLINVAVIYNKYFKSSKDQLQRYTSDYSSLSGNKISKYDDVIKKYSKTIEWDWRLLSAQMYQESHFDPNARSWAGAYGLMQLMPATASMYGINDNSTAEQNIRGGILYLSWLDDYWKKRIINEEERIKFILASYNAGLGHVIDARSLAKEMGFNNEIWDKNVSYCILLKSSSKYYTRKSVKYGYCRGKEPFLYVKSILNRFEHYKNVST
jgi:membrane-bound lytic murein transglycosylase F